MSSGKQMFPQKIKVALLIRDSVRESFSLNSCQEAAVFGDNLINFRDSLNV